MTTLTISRQLGSEGTYIGKKVAEALGYHYVDIEVDPILANAISEMLEVSD